MSILGCDKEADIKYLRDMVNLVKNHLNKIYKHLDVLYDDIELIKSQQNYSDNLSINSNKYRWVNLGKVIEIIDDLINQNRFNQGLLEIGAYGALVNFRQKLLDLLKDKD